jgi:hypothetical protein
MNEDAPVEHRVVFRNGLDQPALNQGADLEAQPLRRTFLATAGLGIVGRDDPLRRPP